MPVVTARDASLCGALVVDEEVLFEVGVDVTGQYYDPVHRTARNYEVLMSGEYDHLIERLQTISEDIADLGMDRLRSSINGEIENYGNEERQLGKARRAVEKAANELRRI